MKSIYAGKEQPFGVIADVRWHCCLLIN